MGSHDLLDGSGSLGNDLGRISVDDRLGVGFGGGDGRVWDIETAASSGHLVLLEGLEECGLRSSTLEVVRLKHSSLAVSNGSRVRSV